MNRAALAVVALSAFAAWFWSGRARAAGMVISGPEQVRAMIERINAEELGGQLDAADVMAFVEIESGFDPAARRAEPHLNDASLGLMQTLYSTAKDRGYGGPPEGLFDPETGLRVGMRHLIWTRDYLQSRMGREPTLDEWVGAYNAGVGNVLKGFLPLGYIAKWKAARARYE